MKLSRSVAAAAAVTMVASGLAVMSASATTTVGTAPVRSIGGTVTKLVEPRGLAVAPDGTIYAGDNDGDNSILVFAPGANGYAKPIREITGAATGIDYPDGIDLDAAGFIYTANYDLDSVTVHAPSANGNAAPVRTISGALTGLSGPGGLEVGPDGRIYVVGYDSNDVRVFAPGANGNIAPQRVITGANTMIYQPEDVQVGPGGEIYVANNGSSQILVFGPSANGDVAPQRVIEGDQTKIDSPMAVDLDSSGNLYVADRSGISSILVFPKGANGDVAPTKVLTGPSTGLTSPWNLFVDADRNVYTINSGSYGRIVVHAPLVPFEKPSAATQVKVAGKAKAKKRTVSWQASAKTGDDTVVYEVVVKKGKKVTFRTTTTATKVTVSRAGLKAGKHTVTVTASNRGGAGGVASTSFKVAKIKPGKVQDVEVLGKPKAAKRTVRWVAPWDGGAKITGYQVVVKKGKNVLVERTVKAKKRSLKLAKGVLARGKNTVLVTAENAKGVGPAGTAKFSVKK